MKLKTHVGEATGRAGAFNMAGPLRRGPRYHYEYRRLSSTELASSWQAEGDMRARDELFERSLPLARRLASRYASPYEPIEGLVEVASAGLLGAVDRFEPERRVAFEAFAVRVILGELKRYLRSTGWTEHRQRHAQEMALRVARASRQIHERTGRSPRIDELATHLQVDIEEVVLGLEDAVPRDSRSLRLLRRAATNPPGVKAR